MPAYFYATYNFTTGGYSGNIYSCRDSFRRTMPNNMLDVCITAPAFPENQDYSPSWYVLQTVSLEEGALILAIIRNSLREWRVDATVDMVPIAEASKVYNTRRAHPSSPVFVVRGADSKHACEAAAITILVYRAFAVYREHATAEMDMLGLITHDGPDNLTWYSESGKQQWIRAYNLTRGTPMVEPNPHYALQYGPAVTRRLMVAAKAPEEF